MSSNNISVAHAAYEKLLINSDSIADRLNDDTSNIIMVGTATCGIAAGANEVIHSFNEQLAANNIEAEILEVGCMGHCYNEPMAIVKSIGFPALVFGNLNPGQVRLLVNNFLVNQDPMLETLMAALGKNEFELPTLDDLPRFGLEKRRLLKRCGFHDPKNISQAISLGAYSGLRKAIGMDSADIIDIVKKSGLRGLGGAGFPTWKKWDACKVQTDPVKYVICNADEGDPGAFMDRTILESDPHSIIEGMIIAALAIGSKQGYVYVRAEYPLAVKQITLAIEQARASGILGKNILGIDLEFDIIVNKGAGAFVCGESSALMHSIEGKRGMPRARPPQSVVSGLFQKPTVLNNVKSFASVGHIFSKGSNAFVQVGSEKSKGTAVFALAGKIANPGLVEVPMGTTLRKLIFDIGGGVPNDKKFKAVQIGGPSGGCLPESLLDTPIDFDALTSVGSMMGSGGMVILDEDNCMVETARFFLEFTQRESCGKCTFCRIGTKHMLDILDRIIIGQGNEQDLDNLKRLASDIAGGSLCNLGKTAPNPVMTTLKFFESEYQAHIEDKTCPAKVCKELMAYYILPEKCARGCDACVGSCPPEAIWTNRKRLKIIEQSKCVKCNSCIVACPPDYDAIVKISPLKEVPPSQEREEGEVTH